MINITRVGRVHTFNTADTVVKDISIRLDVLCGSGQRLQRTLACGTTVSVWHAVPELFTETQVTATTDDA